MILGTEELAARELFKKRSFCNEYLMLVIDLDMNLHPVFTISLEEASGLITICLFKYSTLTRRNEIWNCIFPVISRCRPQLAYSVTTVLLWHILSYNRNEI